MPVDINIEVEEVDIEEGALGKRDVDVGRTKRFFFNVRFQDLRYLITLKRQVTSLLHFSSPRRARKGCQIWYSTTNDHSKAMSARYIFQPTDEFLVSYINC